MSGSRWAGTTIALTFVGLIVAGIGLTWRKGDELATLRGHTSVVRSLAITQDGKLLVSASDDHTLRFWDLVSLKLMRTVEAHEGPVRVVSIAPDNSIASAGDDKTIRFWNSAGDSLGEPLSVDSRMIEALAFAPDGSAIAAGGTDGQVRIWPLPARTPARSFKGSDKHIHGLAFAPDSATLAAASDHGDIRFWNLKSWSQSGTVTAGRRHVHGIAFSPNGASLAAAVTGRGICSWSVPGLQEIPSVDGAGLVLSLSSSTDGTRIATSHEGGELRLWNVANGELLKSYSGHHGPVMAVVFLPDGQIIASAGSDHTIKLWPVSHDTDHHR